MAGRWGIPAFCVAMAGALYAAAALGGQPSLGLQMGAVMVAYGGALLFLGDRSETVRILRGQPRDERLRSMDLRATALAGVAGMIAALGGFLWEVAHGRDGMPFAMVAAVAGIAYLASLAWFRFRE